MRRLLAIFLLSFTALMAHAQQADSLRLLSAVDSTLTGLDIVNVLGPNVTLNQTEPVHGALEQYIISNAEKPVQGYRIRVFYDNSPQARSKSESIEKALRTQFPDTGVYRSFESPNYKVTVGDFRSKDDALRIYMVLRGTYPTSYIIKEQINYPL